MYDFEAVYQDADIEMMEMQQEAAQMERMRRQGVCTHQSAVGRSRTGEIFYPEQEGLVGDQHACTDGCGRVFESMEDWSDAIRRATWCGE